MTLSLARRLFNLCSLVLCMPRLPPPCSPLYIPLQACTFIATPSDPSSLFATILYSSLAVAVLRLLISSYIALHPPPPLQSSPPSSSLLNVVTVILFSKPQLPSIRTATHMAQIIETAGLPGRQSSSEPEQQLHTASFGKKSEYSSSTVGSGGPSITTNIPSSQEQLLRLVKPPLPKCDREALDLIESLTCHADLVQAETLSTILHKNAGAEYLQRHGLQGRSDRESFKMLLPVITYEDLQPEIQRIANGDTSPILSAYPVSEFLTSSGTSAGERKLMPTIHDEFERRCLLYSFLMPIMNQYVPDLDKGKGMYFYFIKSEVKTPGGLLARPVLTSYYKSHWFTERPYDPYNLCTSPNETVLCPDSFQSMYCQMLCGLLQRADVLRMGAVFASGFLRAIRFLQDHWQALCHDIRTAELSDAITHQPSRRAVGQLLAAAGPNAELADAVAQVCASCKKNSAWEGIIPRIWPRTKYIDVIVTGAMAQYIPTLNMYSGGLPLVCTMYASSECYFGVNLHPLCKPADVSYTIVPNMAYFEFLPVLSRGSNIQAHDHAQLPTTREVSTASSHEKKEECNERQLVELVDVQVGCEYELVVTTYAGLYRYRVGDILRVTGFHNKAPQFEFVCRKNVALSIDSDKTDEDTLHRAVEAAISMHLNHTSAALVEYTSYADLSTIPGHYVLFWELQYSVKSEGGTGIIRDDYSQEMDILKSGMMEQCCLSVEEMLDSVYRQGRAAACKSIGPLEIRVVRPGSFEALMDYCLSRGASINQYKAPRCVKAPPIVELMNARVTSSHFSPRCPTWHHLPPAGAR